MGLEQLLDTSDSDAVAYRPEMQATALCIFPHWVDIARIADGLRERHGKRFFEVIDDPRAGFCRLVVAFWEVPPSPVWYVVIERLRLAAEEQGVQRGKQFRNGRTFSIDWVQDPSGP